MSTDAATLTERSQALHAQLAQRSPLYRARGRLPWHMRVRRLVVATGARRLHHGRQVGLALLLTTATTAFLGLTGDSVPVVDVAVVSVVGIVVACTRGWAVFDAVRCASTHASRPTWLADRAWRAAAAIQRHDATATVSAAADTVLLEVERLAAALADPRTPARVLPKASGRWATVSGSEGPDVLLSLLVNDVALLSAVADHVATCPGEHHDLLADPLAPLQAWDILLRTT